LYDFVDTLKNAAWWQLLQGMSKLCCDRGCL
jgi:hypothetical protein